jgi:hypothetical protein
MQQIQRHATQALLQLSQQCTGSKPTHRERRALLALGRRAAQPYSAGGGSAGGGGEGEGEALLRALHAAAGLGVPFAPTGPHWKQLGFQQEDPVSDIRYG